MNLDDVALFGVTGASLVVILVQLAKTWKLPRHHAQQAASVAALVVAAGWEAYNIWPAEVGPYLKTLVVALLLFTSAVGGYHIAQGSDNKSGGGA